MDSNGSWYIREVRNKQEEAVWQVVHQEQMD
jgi:hypothetical protein